MSASNSNNQSSIQSGISLRLNYKLIHSLGDSIQTGILTPMYLLKKLYPTDDSFVESLISFFFMSYEQIFFSYNSKLSAILTSLCKSPLIEAKLIDFFIAFLFSRYYFDSSTDENQFSYLKILKLSNKQISPKTVHHTVASNILDFLVNYLKTTAEYLLPQPRVFFDMHGISSVQEFKAQTHFRIQTSCLVSLCDLLVHLFDVLAEKNTKDLLVKLKTLNLDAIIKGNQFKMIKVDKGDELQQTVGVLSLRTCNRILQMVSLKSALINTPSLVFFGDLEFFIKDVEDSIIELIGHEHTTPQSRLQRYLAQKATGRFALIVLTHP